MTRDSNISIVLSAGATEIAQVEHWVAKLATDHSLSRALAHRIDLCLTELATNVVSYAYPGREPGTISMHFSKLPDKLVISVMDDGEPFDPTAYTLGDMADSLESAPIGGRGIRLVRHFADDVRYRRHADANELILTFLNPGLDDRSGVSPGAALARAQARVPYRFESFIQYVV